MSPRAVYSFFSLPAARNSLLATVKVNVPLHRTVSNGS